MTKLIWVTLCWGQILALGAEPLRNLDLYSFGDRTGQVQFDMDGDEDEGRIVKELPDGKLLVGGNVRMSWSGSDKSLAMPSLVSPPAAALGTDIGLVRLLPNGKLDGGFSFSGRFHLDVGSADDTLSDIALFEDGSFILVGNSRKESGKTGFLVKLTRDGKVDSSWKLTESALALLPWSQTILERGHALRDGSILVSGYTAKPQVKGAQQRRHFILHLGANTSVQFSYLLPEGETLLSSELDESGKLVLGGCNKMGAFVERLLPTGKRDPSFGTQGRVQFAPNGTRQLCVSHLLIDPSAAQITALVSDLKSKEAVRWLKMNRQGKPGTLAQQGRAQFPRGFRALNLFARPDGGTLLIGSAGSETPVLHLLLLSRSGKISEFTQLPLPERTAAASEQRDGKILLIGTSSASISDDYQVTRLIPPFVKQTAQPAP